MEFRLLHRDFPCLGTSAGTRPEAVCCLKVSASQERPESLRLTVRHTSSILSSIPKTDVLAAFTFEATGWLPAPNDTLTNTARSKVLEEEILQQLNENLPITMEYSVSGKTVKTFTQYKLGEFLDDNPRLLDASTRRAKPLTTMYCLVRARFMQIPSTLSLVVRQPRRLFRRIVKTKTVIKFSFDIDKWEKVPRSIHTFENISPNEYVYYKNLFNLDPSLPLIIRTTVGGRVTDTETNL